MKTLSLFHNSFAQVPVATAWSLQSIAEFKGKQTMYMHQSPQRLRSLKEHSIIESAVSSNRIEEVEVDKSRIGTVIFGKRLLNDRDEEEVRGYRTALNLIHSHAEKLRFDRKTVLKLHSLARGGAGDAGRYKTRDSDIIERYPDGKTRIRFRTVSAKQTHLSMDNLFRLFRKESEDHKIPGLILASAANLDFLCIHPFRDGNDRVSRLLLLMHLYHLGIEAGRYISLERLIEENKDRYYQTLELSSKGWNEGKHDPWPYINFILFIIKEAFKEFESRMGKKGPARGEKTELIIQAIDKNAGPFAFSWLKSSCPEVGSDMIRHLLKNLKKEGRLASLGRGQSAKWQKTPKWRIR